MRRAWVWIVAVLVAALAVAAYLAFRARGKKHDANRALADGIEAWTGPRTARQLEQLHALEQAAQRDEKAVAAARVKVDEVRADLESTYSNLDLSPEEIVARTRHLRI